jgi:hypothetical protein
VNVSAQTVLRPNLPHAASSATPTENETCGNFGGMIAWYSYFGNMIARQTIRYEVPRGLFLFSVCLRWARNKIVLSVLVDGRTRARTNLWVDPRRVGGVKLDTCGIFS